MWDLISVVVPRLEGFWESVGKWGARHPKMCDATEWFEYSCQFYESYVQVRNMHNNIMLYSIVKHVGFRVQHQRNVYLLIVIIISRQMDKRIWIRITVDVRDCVFIRGLKPLNLNWIWKTDDNYLIEFFFISIFDGHCHSWLEFVACAVHIKICNQTTGYDWNVTALFWQNWQLFQFI